MLKPATAGAIAASTLFLATTGPTRAQVLNDPLVNGPPLAVSALLLASGPFSNPSVFGLRANIGECVRIEGTGATFDAEFTVVAPDGTVFRDNNSGAGSLPLVKIGGAPDNGVYTLVINQFNGFPVVNGTASFTYGRFTGGAANPNCAAPTPPV